ncbi:MAG: alpha/beta fold hydrolase [Solirubrobacterales bacterium]|nr:alpha/beta fold hydrolase [Solirubrobacterales bacterium]
MATANSSGTSLYWESTGDGPPVLLIMGLGMNATGWWRTIPRLAEAGLRVLAFDNRGVGRSDRPEGPYTMAMLADDAAAVLDAAALERAHVYGISLGGMIAQELALRHPHRVDRLVLGATTPGGERSVAPPERTLAFFQRRAEMTALEAVWASVPYNYSARTRADHGDWIAQDIAQRLRYPIESAPYLAQLQAAMGHDRSGQLGDVRAPTLVVHGAEDVMISPENGRMLAELIPDARFAEFPGAAHLYFTDEPVADREAAEFLRAA